MTGIVYSAVRIDILTELLQ